MKVNYRTILNMAVFMLLIASAVSCSAADLFCGKKNSRYILSNKYTSIEIRASDLTLSGIRVPGSCNLVCEPGWPLFRINLVQDSTEWFITRKVWSISGREAKKHYAKTSVSGNNGVLELHYDGCPTDTVGHLVDVIVSISLSRSAKYSLWSISIRNAGAFKLGELRFPVLSGLGSTRKGTEKTDFVVCPFMSGLKGNNPRKGSPFTEGMTDGPGSGFSVQVLAYCDGLDKDALMLSPLDNDGYRKMYESFPMTSGKSFTWQIVHYPDGNMENGLWRSPYPTAVAALSGDWYDAAKIYRSWLSNQSRWRPVVDRKEMPDWLKNLSVWWQGQEWDPAKDKFKSHVQRLKNIRDMMGEDIGFHWYIWQKVPNHDHDYPDYFPAQPGFKEAVAEAEKYGIRCMPYINIRLFEEQLDMWKTENAEQWAIPDANGKLYQAIWDNERHMVTMCAGTKYWRDKMTADVEKIFNDYGPSAVYLDELHVYPYLCYAKNHEHKDYGGNYLAKGYRELLTRVRKDMGDKKIVLAGENMSETYADLQDIQLVAHSDQDPNSIPLFQTVMKDATIELGLTMRRDESLDMDCYAARTGFALARGRQLGWISFDQGDMLDPAYTSQVNFLRKCAHCRRAGLDFLLYGEFLRTPVVLAGPMQSVRWDMTKPNYTLNPIMTEAYKSPKGELGIVAVNITNQQRKSDFILNFKDWPISKGKTYKISIWRDNEWSEPKTFTVRDKITVDIAAYEPVIIKLSK